MRALPSELPAALHDVAKTIGLEYLQYAPAGSARLPVACGKLPLFKNPEEDIARLPVQTNFHCTVLDMDNEEDRKEYETTMSYLAAGYGMRLVNIERALVKKNKKRFVRDPENDEGGYWQDYEDDVRRIYLEYYAPYRIVPPMIEQ